MDWIHDGKPSYLPLTYQVWLDDGQVRMVRRIETLDPSTLWFLDNRHPLANAICDDRRIRAWRMA